MVDDLDIDVDGMKVVEEFAFLLQAYWWETTALVVEIVHQVEVGDLCRVVGLLD